MKKSYPLFLFRSLGRAPAFRLCQSLTESRTDECIIFANSDIQQALRVYSLWLFWLRVRNLMHTIDSRQLFVVVALQSYDNYKWSPLYGEQFPSPSKITSIQTESETFTYSAKLLDEKYVFSSFMCCCWCSRVCFFFNFAIALKPHFHCSLCFVCSAHL